MHVWDGFCDDGFYIYHDQIKRFSVKVSSDRFQRSEVFLIRGSLTWNIGNTCYNVTDPWAIDTVRNTRAPAVLPSIHSLTNSTPSCSKPLVTYISLLTTFSPYNPGKCVQFRRKCLKQCSLEWNCGKEKSGENSFRVQGGSGHRLKCPGACRVFSLNDRAQQDCLCRKHPLRQYWSDWYWSKPPTNPCWYIIVIFLRQD